MYLIDKTIVFYGKKSPFVFMKIPLCYENTLLVYPILSTFYHVVFHPGLC